MKDTWLSRSESSCLADVVLFEQDCATTQEEHVLIIFPLCPIILYPPRF